MKLLLLFLLASSGLSQSCPHTLTRTPVGPVLVYQNGKLLNVGDYSSVTPAGKTMPTIAPLVFLDQDAMSVVISRAVPLTFTVPGDTPQTITYFSYAIWREDWKCFGNSGTPAGLVQIGGLTVANGQQAATPVCEFAGRSGTWPIPVGTIGDALHGVPWLSAVFQVQSPDPVPCPPSLETVAAAQSMICYSGIWTPYDHDMR